MIDPYERWHIESTPFEHVGAFLLGLALFVYPRAAAVLRKVRSTR